MNSFKTVTSPKNNIITFSVTCAIMFALAFLALSITVAFWLFLEIVIAAIFTILFFRVKRAYWIIEFQDKLLILNDNGNGKTYQVDQLTVADFEFKQTEKQKALNSGDVRMVNYPLFMMYDVQNYSEFEAYVRRNFK
ncbi:MAG: hypothetical protein IJD70_10280 [Clostridia bacterium]|nr:hypothetical protein [Clostridia bacterium]